MKLRRNSTILCLNNIVFLCGRWPMFPLIFSIHVQNKILACAPRHIQMCTTGRNTCCQLWAAVGSLLISWEALEFLQGGRPYAHLMGNIADGLFSHLYISHLFCLHYWLSDWLQIGATTRANIFIIIQWHFSMILPIKGPSHSRLHILGGRVQEDVLG